MGDSIVSRFRASVRSPFAALALPRRLLRAAVAAAAVLALSVGAASSSDAAPGDEPARNGSGAGALVQYEMSQVVDGRPVTATVDVFVVVPRRRTLPTYLAVGVREVDDETGAEVFSGRGTAEPGTFTVGENFARARVTGEVTVPSTTTSDSRVVVLDVRWSPQHRTQRIGRIPVAPGADESERHRGLIRRMTGYGIVTITDPADAGHVITISSPGLGCAWKTQNTSDFVAAPSSKAATTSGYWSGYWTWYWNGTKWVARWTWVWNTGSGTYTTS